MSRRPRPSRAVFSLACPVVIFLASLVLPAGGTSALAKSPSAPLDELRKTFTIDGKPVPPEVFRDMGDGDMADSGSIIVTIDVKAAIGSNLYFDDIKANGDWFTQTHKRIGDDLTEESAYRFIGATENKLLVVIASYSGGGSGVFYTLHILDAQAGRGFDLEGKLYDRLNLTVLRSVALGDRWDGTVKITGNVIAITATGGVPAGEARKPTTVTLKAERP
ncbi:hypothetical protein [Methyloferula stellata]|uniref:hypothetical protein n=1 Tax=Methyloferula stellata TaxID=876270 RepID=UPI00037B188B|nr:hypothetical protein [Methyloferula stellata]